MKKVETINAPKALGPYSQGIIVNGFVYTSGQLGINPKTNTLEEDIISQSTLAFENIKAILESANTSLDKVVKTTVFLKDLKDFSIVNSIYEKYFISNPARSCVQVSSLPKNALIEIEAIAVLEE